MPEHLEKGDLMNYITAAIAMLESIAPESTREDIRLVMVTAGAMLVEMGETGIIPSRIVEMVKVFKRGDGIPRAASYHEYQKRREAFESIIGLYIDLYKDL